MVESPDRPPDEVCGDLMMRWKDGDEQAAAELYNRYVRRLTALTRSRLPEMLLARVDPEDVVQSACRSFLLGAREGQFAVRPGDDVWQLLVTITLRKLRRQVRLHNADRRAVVREARGGEGGFEGSLPSREPSPVEAAAVLEEVERVRSLLDPRRRQIFDLRLLGYDSRAIAAEIGRCERTVRRLLGGIEAVLVGVEE